MPTRPAYNVYASEQYPDRDAAVSAGAIRDVSQHAYAAASGFAEGSPVFITRGAWAAVVVVSDGRSADDPEAEAAQAERLVAALKEIGMFPVRAGGPMMAASTPGRIVTVPLYPEFDRQADGAPHPSTVFVEVLVALDGIGPGVFFTVALVGEGETR